MNPNEHTQSLPAVMAAMPARRDLTLALRVAAILAACAGLFAAGVLSASHMLGLPVACGGSLNCVTVAIHPSSQVLGVPIAFFGVAAYAAMLLMLGRVNFDRRTRVAVVFVAAVGTVVSAGLLYYAQTVIRATCTWCVASGIAMTMLLLLSACLLPRTASSSVRPRTVAWALGAAALLAIAVQTIRMERTASVPPIAAERIAGVHRTALVNTGHVMGAPDAPVAAVVFADLLCRPCGRVLGELAKFQRAHPDGFRIVYRHQPLTAAPGHETSREAAVFAEMAAEVGKFWPFVTAVHQHRGAKNRVVYLDLLQIFGVDRSQSEARLNDPADPAVVRVERDIALAEQLGIESTPAIIVAGGPAAPVSVSQRSLPRLLSSPAVRSLLQR